MRKKLVKSGMAVVVAGAIAVGATFAWQGQTQRARNEAQGDINPGGRLHDDYFIGNRGEDVLTTGAVKRVYVENFTTEPLFVRVKLREFMEVGEGAGTGAGTKVTVTGEAEPDFTDPTTWHTYQLGENTSFRTYWNWSLSKTTDPVVSYLPTFNMNKDSVVPDVNGSWKGEFADYVDWSALSAATALPNGFEFVAAAAPLGAGVKGWEVHDNDEDTTDEPNLSITPTGAAQAGYEVGIDTRERDKYVYGQHFLNSGELDFAAYNTAVGEYETAYNAWVTAGKPASPDAAYTAVETKLDALKAFWTFNGPAPDDDTDVDISVGTVLDDTGSFPAVPEKMLHEVSTTLPAKRDVLTLSAWLDLSPAEQTGDYWVYDDSAAPGAGGGWFYWANPLTAHTATAPLLTGYTPGNSPENSWY